MRETYTFKKAGQYTDNVSPRNFRVTSVAIDKQQVRVLHFMRVCLFSHRYSTGNAHAPYFHLWHVWVCYIFPRFLVNDKFLGKKVIEHK